MAQQIAGSVDRVMAQVPIGNQSLRMDAERIRQIRQRMQMTQEDFAHLIGVTFSTVNRWENGKSSPNRIAARLLFGLEKKFKQV